MVVSTVLLVASIVFHRIESRPTDRPTSFPIPDSFFVLVFRWSRAAASWWNARKWNIEQQFLCSALNSHSSLFPTSKSGWKIPHQTSSFVSRTRARSSSCLVSSKSCSVSLTRKDWIHQETDMPHITSSCFSHIFIRCVRLGLLHSISWASICKDSQYSGDKSTTNLLYHLQEENRQRKLHDPLPYIYNCTAWGGITLCILGWRRYGDATLSCTARRRREKMGKIRWQKNKFLSPRIGETHLALGYRKRGWSFLRHPMASYWDQGPGNGGSWEKWYQPSDAVRANMTRPRQNRLAPLQSSYTFFS